LNRFLLPIARKWNAVEWGIEAGFIRSGFDDVGNRIKKRDNRQWPVLSDA